MNYYVRKFLPIIIVVGMFVPLVACHGHPTKPKIQIAPSIFNPLQKYLQEHYLALFKEAPELEFSHHQIQDMHNYLDKAQDYCVGEYKNLADQRKSKVDHLSSELHDRSSKISDSERHKLKCQIQNEKVLRSQDEMLAQHAIPIAYANKQVKLQLIEQWPSDLKHIKHEIATGAYKNRKWGDVKDIGFRQISPNQKDDIPLGKKEIKQMRRSGMMPPVVKDKEVVDYVKRVAHKVAAHSDLRVPLHVTVLNAKEINAFSLPGGYLFVERGLLEAADNEAELAGVLGHEMAHVVCRHGHKLMEKATIAGIFYQAAQVAAMVLTGGVAGIGTYYAIRYGFYGLGLALDLKLLGVSREFELQADQLGMQYAWNSGYDPNGFIKFFDKMATTQGYVNGVGWFHDHPPFYKRMKDAMREMMFLPKKKHYIVNTSAFKRMKKELAKVAAQAKKEEKDAPSLKPTEKGCPAPKKIEYKPNEPIETLCHLPEEKPKKKQAENQ